jgi:tetratricopeptide (TPR) repeat protein
MAASVSSPLGPPVSNSLRVPALENGVSSPPEGAAGAPTSRPGSIWLTLGPIGFVLALLLVATAYSGAFEVSQWAPPSLFVLFMLLALAVRGGGARLPDRWLALALAGAWGLAAWAACSAAWAPSPADALEGAARLLLYAGVMTLPLIAVADVRSLRIVGQGVFWGVAAIALYVVAKLLLDGSSIYLAGRLNGPIDYRNATALLFCLPFWPLLGVAATRGHGRGLRGAALGLAVLMLALAFVTQSRGVLLGLGVGAAVSLGLGPDRVRRGWLALLCVALVVIASHWLLTPFTAYDGGHGLASDGDIRTAAEAMIALLLGAGAIGFVLAVFDAGLRAADPGMRFVRGAARAGLLVLAIAAVGGGLAAAHGHPVRELKQKWSQFKSLQTTTTTATRYTSAGGQRYDLWRVALDELRARPLAGVGEAGYQFGYYRARRSNRNLDDPHGLLFQIGAELGVIGLLLFALIPLGVLGSMRRNWRRAPLHVRRQAAGLAAAGGTFIGQSLVDWMWRIPGLVALGLLCLALAAALLARAAEAPAPAARGASAAAAVPLWSRGRRVLAATALLAGLALTLSLFLSDLYITRARDDQGHDPAAQLAAARTAAALDPWAVTPHYLQSSALETLGQRAAARSQLLRATQLEPGNQVSAGLLGDFEARGGNFSKARVYYLRALALNPLDVGLRELARSGGRSGR